MSIEPILIDVPMPIITPRLRLELWQPGYGAAFNEMRLESRESLRPWMTWVKDDSLFTPEDAEKRMREAYAKAVRREQLYMIAFERESGRMIASTGYHDIDWTVPSFAIGYWVRSTAQGKGYATEVTLGLLHYAFNQLNAQRVEIGHSVGNDASKRVIEKAGFALEAHRRNDHLLPDGRIADSLYYSHIDVNDVPPLEVRW